MKLDLAAPASFFSLAVKSQVAAASFSHFFKKDVLAAPASFFSAAAALQVGPSAHDCVARIRMDAANVYLMGRTVDSHGDGIHDATHILPPKIEVNMVGGQLMVVQNTLTTRLARLCCGGGLFTREPPDLLNRLCGNGGSELRRGADQDPKLEWHRAFGSMAIKVRSGAVYVDGRAVKSVIACEGG